MSENLIVKYRPQVWDEVIGQPAVVASLKQIVKKRDSQIFLFYGPAGTGKTTLSRLVAHYFGVEPNAVMDHNAATKTGVDDMRAIEDMLRYRPFGKSGMRAVIIDECHRLSGNAWDSLLKGLEEPSPWVVWCFCTTVLSKVPKTILTRCAKYELKLIEEKELGELYDFVAEQEGLRIPDDVVDLLIKEAKGSPRQLLSNIVVARTSKTKKEAAGLLKSAVEADATHELCQFLTTNGSWSKAMLIVEKLKNENPESVRIAVSNYLAACAKNSKDDKKAIAFLSKLEAFATPYTSYDGIAPLLLSIGRALFAE